MDLPGGKAGSGKMLFVQVVTAEGMELWMVLIFCNIETLLFPVNSELPLTLPYHWFLFPAKIMHSITHIGEVILSSC